MTTETWKNETTENTQNDVVKNKDLAAFSYILVFAPVLLMTRRESKFIQFHALQALYLGVFFILFALLPGKLTYLNVLVVAGALMGFLEAQAGHFYRMPIVNDLIVRKITLQNVFEKCKNGVSYILNIFRRIFREGPGFAIHGTVNAVEKIRGIDTLKVNSKVEDLKSEVEDLEEKVSVLEKKVETEHLQN